MKRRTSAVVLRGSPGGALLLAAVLLGCGSAPDPDSRAARAGKPGERAQGAAPTSGITVPPAPPPPLGPERIAAKAEPSVEKCIEGKLHSPDYDRLHPRDPLRKLRRLQVKADCESKLAAR